MFKRTVSGLVHSALILPTLAWASPNEDLAKGMAQGQAALVAQAILKGPDPNTKNDSGDSALTTASLAGHQEVVNL